MINTIALTRLFDLPLVAYGGIGTLLLILFTATVGFLNYNGISIIPFKWHPVLAIITITTAVIHGTLGLSIFLGY